MNEIELKQESGKLNQTIKANFISMVDWLSMPVNVGLLTMTKESC